jgi:hypothetical protein
VAVVLQKWQQPEQLLQNLLQFLLPLHSPQLNPQEILQTTFPSDKKKLFT